MMKQIEPRRVLAIGGSDFWKSFGGLCVALVGYCFFKAVSESGRAAAFLVFWGSVALLVIGLAFGLNKWRRERR
jgi:lipopolysaccharide export LptBFGC system permease protein LptF